MRAQQETKKARKLKRAAQKESEDIAVTIEDLVLSPGIADKDLENMTSVKNNDNAISHLSAERKQHFLEQVVTEDNIKSFCNAISSEDTTLVDLLIEYKCLVELPHVLERLLAESYARLKIQNVPLTRDMQVFVESKLIDLRFFTNRDEENKKCTTVSLDDVKTRIKLTCLQAERMILKYSRGTGNSVDDREFILLGRFVAQNIRTLKRQLKGTYTRLPWEEVEFLLACFTSAVCEPRESDIIYKLVLDQERLLKHLNYFVTKLREVEQDLKEKDINIKLALGNRSLIIRNILNVSPDFVDLYSDHDLVKSVYSLKRISSYIRQALDLYPNEGMEDVETLVLERTLQVIGESLKNTPDSPNVSEEVHHLLARQAPRQARELSTALRDSLSHSRSYTRRPKQDAQFHQRLREDLCKMEEEITYILYRKKKDAVEKFLNKIMDCCEAEELEVLLQGIEGIQEEDIKFSKDLTPEFLLAKNILETLEKEVVDKTGVTNLFDKAEKILQSKEKRVEEVRENYVEGASDIKNIVKAFSAGCDIIKIKQIAKSCLVDMMPEDPPEKFKSFLNIIMNICLHARQSCDRDSLDAHSSNVRRKSFEIIIDKTVTLVEFMVGKISGIDDFRNKIEAGPEDESEVHLKIKQVFHDVVNALDKQQDRSTLQKELENITNLHRAKGELIKHFDSRLRGESNAFDGLASCVEKLCLKPKNIQNLEKFYEEGDYDKCKSRIQIIEDHYGKFAQIVEELSLFSREKYAEAFEAFFGTLKLKGKAKQNLLSNINQQIEKRNKEISSYFSSRLLILDGLLSRAGAEPRGPHYAAVEMLALELTEILDNMSMFGDGAQFMDDFCPVLIGKNLRNYLAHGDPLADGLPSCPRTAITRAAALLLRAGGELVRRGGALIGGNIVADFGRLRRMYDVCLGDVVRQDAMFTAIQEENEDLVKDCISNGVDPRGTDFDGWTGLHYAAVVGNTQILQLFLDHYVNLQAKDIYGNTPVQIAYDYSRINVIQYLIERNYLAAGDVIADGNTLLHLAAKNGRADLVSELLNGEKVNSENTYSQTPLHLACEHGHTGVVQLLLEADATVQSQTSHRETPLFLAVRGGHENIVRLLLETGAVAYAKDDETTRQSDREVKTLLHIAAKNGHTEVIKTLFSNVDDNILMDFIRAPAGNGSLALHLAAERGHIGVVEELLARGCSIEEEDEDGRTALHVAAANGFTTVLKLLLNKGSAINAVENHLRTSLHLAVQRGQSEVVQELLSRGSDVRAETEEGYTALHTAAANGRTEILQILLDHGARIEAVTHDGFTALHAAVKYSHTEAVKCLINHAKKSKQSWEYVNFTDKNNSTALHVAVAAGDEECVRELLKAGAMTEARDVTFCTALHVAAKYGVVAIIRLLIEKGCDINATTPENNWSALFFAADHEQLEAVAVLIEKGIKLDTLTENSETVLHCAVAGGDINIVQAILRAIHKEDLRTFINIPRGDQMTAIHFSVKNGYKEITHLLLNEGADVEAADADGYTAAIHAAIAGNMDIFLALLDKKADVNVISKYGSTPLRAAALRGHFTIVKKLLELGTDPYLTDTNDQTALHKAAVNGHTEVAELLLKSGINVDSEDNDGLTPLHLAAGNGFYSTVKLLLRNSANTDKRDKDNCTPLQRASHYGRLEVIKLLLENGADVANATLSDAWTALHFAANYESIVRILLDAGAKVDASDNFRRTALHYAAQDGCEGVVSLLFDFGADPELKDSEGWTPLFLAAQNDRIGVLKELLSRGVNVNAADAANITALHMAAFKGYREIVQLLLDSGADADCVTERLATPLHASAIGGSHNLVGILVTRGVDVGAVDADGRTALHHAAASGHLKFVEELAKFDALDRETENWQTALKLSADGGHASVCEFLNKCRSERDHI